MDLDAVRELFDRQLRQEARPDGPGTRIERVDGVVRQTGAADDWNGIRWSDLDASTADAAIAAQVRHFTARGRAFEWKLYAHDRPGDLGARLAAAGFAAEPEEAVMVAPVRDLPTAVDLPEGLRLLQVTDAAGVELMVDVHARAFGTDSDHLRHRLLSRLREAPDTVVPVVAMAGDRAVSAARMELPPEADFAGLWGGGTVAEWRGRGLYRALIAFRARIAAERGYRYLQVDASDQSRPILERLGFVALTTTTPYVYGG
ncbi:GNAT family acetyltransferase [Streptomyces himastatinicus ATCC 53653]|uniref:GNAT family acetyltransferase n=1 Tax=Streptomyces himastatinicus ATCC 53653 TaxID=457427 RepID=D9WWS2_9ACTN|nr:GNAT family N-acetyltransferase [Streptomyces himastatinicus]EFL28698.1 GNAT family acetyltransferase [Streptomyces himastatinicus ATCC 53653]